MRDYYDDMVGNDDDFKRLPTPLQIFFTIFAFLTIIATVICLLLYS